MAFSENIDLLFGISVVLVENFTDIIVATDTTAYCQKIPIDVFIKALFG